MENLPSKSGLNNVDQPEYNQNRLNDSFLEEEFKNRAKILREDNERLQKEFQDTNQILEKVKQGVENEKETLRRQLVESKSTIAWYKLIQKQQRKNLKNFSEEQHEICSMISKMHDQSREEKIKVNRLKDRIVTSIKQIRELKLKLNEEKK